MKVGDLVKLINSNGTIGLVADLDSFDNPILVIEGKLKAFHHTQVEEVINESR